MAKEFDFVKARLTMRTESKGGRKSPIYLGAEYQFRAHIVIGPASQKEAVLTVKDGVEMAGVKENYLPVEFRQSLGKLAPGETAIVEMWLMFAETSASDAVVPGEEFTLREGHQIIGHGIILERGMAKR